MFTHSHCWGAHEQPCNLASECLFPQRASLESDTPGSCLEPASRSQRRRNTHGLDAGKHQHIHHCPNKRQNLPGLIRALTIFCLKVPFQSSQALLQVLKSFLPPFSIFTRWAVLGWGSNWPHLFQTKAHPDASSAFIWWDRSPGNSWDGNPEPSWRNVREILSIAPFLKLQYQDLSILNASCYPNWSAKHLRHIFTPRQKVEAQLGARRWCGYSWGPKREVWGASAEECSCLQQALKAAKSLWWGLQVTAVLTWKGSQPRRGWCRQSWAVKLETSVAFDSPASCHWNRRLWLGHRLQVHHRQSPGMPRKPEHCHHFRFVL